MVINQLVLSVSDETWLSRSTLWSYL